MPKLLILHVYQNNYQITPVFERGKYALSRKKNIWFEFRCTWQQQIYDNVSKSEHSCNSLLFSFRNILFCCAGPVIKGEEGLKPGSPSLIPWITKFRALVKGMQTVSTPFVLQCFKRKEWFNYPCSKRITDFYTSIYQEMDFNPMQMPSSGCKLTFLAFLNVLAYLKKHCHFRCTWLNATQECSWTQLGTMTISNGLCLCTLKRYQDSWTGTAGQISYLLV